MRVDLFGNESLSCACTAFMRYLTLGHSASPSTVDQNELSFPLYFPCLFCLLISLILLLSSLSKCLFAPFLLIHLHSRCMAIHHNNTHTRPQTLPTLPTPINSKPAQPHTYVLRCTVLPSSHFFLSLKHVLNHLFEHTHSYIDTYSFEASLPCCFSSRISSLSRFVCHSAQFYFLSNYITVTHSADFYSPTLLPYSFLSSSHLLASPRLASPRLSSPHLTSPLTL